MSPGQRHRQGLVARLPCKGQQLHIKSPPCFLHLPSKLSGQVSLHGLESTLCVLDSRQDQELDPAVEGPSQEVASWRFPHAVTLRMFATGDADRARQGRLKQTGRLFGGHGPVRIRQKDPGGSGGKDARSNGASLACLREMQHLDVVVVPGNGVSQRAGAVGGTVFHENQSRGSRKKFLEQTKALHRTLQSLRFLVARHHHRNTWDFIGEHGGILPEGKVLT